MEKGARSVFERGSLSPGFSQFPERREVETGQRDSGPCLCGEETAARWRFFQKKFWMKVGEVGGKTVAEDLLGGGDPAFTKIPVGWAKEVRRTCSITMPTWTSNLPSVQNYTGKNQLSGNPAYGSILQRYDR